MILQKGHSGVQRVLMSAIIPARWLGFLNFSKTGWNNGGHNARHDMREDKNIKGSDTSDSPV